MFEHKYFCAFNKRFVFFADRKRVEISFVGGFPVFQLAFVVTIDNAINFVSVSVRGDIELLDDDTLPAFSHYIGREYSEDTQRSRESTENYPLKQLEIHIRWYLSVVPE